MPRPTARRPAHPVLRTVLVSPQTDARLYAEAVRRGVSRGEVIRAFLKKGLLAAEKADRLGTLKKKPHPAGARVRPARALPAATAPA